MSERCILGIDIGGTTTKFALVAANGEVLTTQTVPTLVKDGPTEFVADLIKHTEAMLHGSTRKDGAASGIAVAVAGTLDSKRDRIVHNPNLEPLVGVPLVKILREKFQCTVVLDADSNTACLGELRFGAGRGAKRLLSLVVGTGLGVGVAVNGEIVRTAHECIGDAGHVIVQPGGPLCTHGCKGCAEALVSAGALESRFKQLSATALPTREIIDSARAGNQCARIALQEAGSWLGIAIASLATVFFPDHIVISGGMSEAGGLLLEPALRSFRSYASPACWNGVEVLPATLGWRATVVGAASMLL